MIEVWHAKQPTWRGDDAPAWPEAYVKVAEVQTNDLDLAFQWTNHIDRAWYLNPGVRAFDAPRLRSTSVGDVLVCDGKVWRCADVGWTLVEASPDWPTYTAGGSGPAPAPAEYGVVILEARGRNLICLFASTPMPYAEATEAAKQFEGSEIVDVDTLRMWKRAMVNGEAYR